MVAVGPAATGRTWRSEVSYSRNSGPRPGSVGKGADGQDRIPSTLGPATMRAVQRPEEEAGNQLKPGDDAGRATARGGGPPAAQRRGGKPGNPTSASAQLANRMAPNSRSASSGRHIRKS